jgi:hypothetical protein
MHLTLPRFLRTAPLLLCLLVALPTGVLAQERIARQPIDLPAGGGNDIIVDGSFEATNPNTSVNPFWGSTSTKFGVAWCDQTQLPTPCQEDGGQITVTGNWYAYFLGTAMAEVTTISQQVTIPADVEATLRFWQRLSFCQAGAADHFMSVRLGGNEVYRIDATSPRCGELDYHPIQVDVSAFAGQTLTLLFHTEKPASALRTSIYVDDVSLVVTPVAPPPGTNVIQDGSFEATNPNTFVNPFWGSTSVLFGTAWCNQSCYQPPRNEARTGDWWAYFLGTAGADMTTISQTVDLTAGTSAMLSFWFQAAGCSGNDNSIFTVALGGTEIWRMTGTNTQLCGATDYTEIVLDVSDFAGGTHELLFSATKPITTESDNWYVDDVSLLVTVSNEAGAETPGTYALSAAYPNPFNPQTRFELAVRQQQHVVVSVYDALGRQVATLFEGQVAAGEARTLTFDAGSLPSGMYMIRAVGETFQEARRVTLMK